MAKMHFLKPKEILNPSDEIKWCKKLLQNTCDKICLHRKLEKSESKFYNDIYKETCGKCNINEVSYEYQKIQQQ